MKGQGNFFGVERAAWQRALALGLNPATAFLVMGRGTAADHRTTPWCVQAIEKYTGISRPRARDAVDALIDAGLARLMLRNGPNRYDLGLGPKPETLPEGEAEQLDLIWLPNEIVTGAGREVPPLELIRQCQDAAVLGLLIGLYDHQNLADESGVNRKILWQKYAREKVFERGEYVIFRFTPGRRTSSHASPLAAPFIENRKAKDVEAGWKFFWDALATLQRLGLVKFFAHLIESELPTAEVMYPCDPAGLAGEAAIAEAAAMAARRLAENRFGDDGRQLVPVLAHMSEVRMVGVARLKYRARTLNGLAWAARDAKWQEIANQFYAIDGEVSDKILAFPTGQNGLKKTA
jgi:hypothetical protein